MADRIGPNFAAELRLAGLSGLPFSWGPDGKIEFDARMPQAQKQAVLQVLAAHDPTRPDSEKTAQAAIAKAAELAILDALVLGEEYARAKGTAEAIARADRIKVEIARRKVALGIA